MGVVVVPVPTAADTPAICTTSLGQSSCDKICCAADQRCHGPNTCTPYSSTYLGTSTYIGGTSTYVAPVRPTSGGVSSATSLLLLHRQSRIRRPSRNFRSRKEEAQVY